MRLCRDDGGIRHVRVSTAIGRFLGEDIGQAIAIDETELIEREQQLMVFDNWLRHNIRHKMTIIAGLVEDLQEDRMDEVADSVRVIQEHGNSLAEQANQG